MQSGFSSPYAVHKTDYFFKTPEPANRRALSSEHHYKSSTNYSNLDYLRLSLSPEPKHNSSLNYYPHSPVYEHKYHQSFSDLSNLFF